MPKNLYTITIKDHSMPQLGLRTFTGAFEATNQQNAIVQAQVFYALELDTDRDQIEIISVIETKP